MTLETMQPFEQSFNILQDRSERIFTPSSSAAVDSDNYLLQTFHQYPHGDFRPTFYNPFEIKHRRRTTRVQLRVLEKSFSENPKPSATVRRILAQKLDMTPRGVQIWFQNRRAKAKLLRRKSSIQHQRHQQQSNQQSSDEENEEEDEEEEDYCSSDSSKSMENNKSPFNAKESSTATTTSDISQSSVLFSQFFANVHSTTSQEVNKNSVFATSFMPNGATNGVNIHPYQNLSRGGSMNWPTWQHSSISDNARTIATVAAATAVATSDTPSTHHYNSTMLSLEGTSNWVSHENNNTNEEMFINQQSLRRESCPVPTHTMVLSDMHYNNYYQQQQPVYLSSPSWSYSMNPRNKKYEESEDSSPMPLLIDRHFSYDSNSSNTSMDYYPIQDMHLNYASYQQLTPPLTNSCSASTFSGSPISLDNLYNDPVVVPQHNNNSYYSSDTSHISSPLSATTLVTDLMPNFV